VAKKTWCIPKLTDEFLAKMDAVLELYERRYNPREPVVCFDEKSKQLLADLREPLPMKPGMPMRVDSEYIRKGTANIFMIVEPKAGKRYTIVRKRRTKKDFAICMEELVGLYPNTDKVHVVMDNLNTHSEKSLVETFSAKKTESIMEFLEFHYTPKHGSWLNMAEIEIGVMETECLDRRIPDIETLDQELSAWYDRRNRQEIRIDWRFTRKKAKEKFGLSTRQN
jgi:hypothetical protein